MLTLIGLHIWFVITAVGYTLLVAHSVDEMELPWRNFPKLERQHFTIPILKILPTAAVLLIGLSAFDYGVHWFTVSYAIFLLLMIIIDFGIVAKPRRFMYLALAAHILSEMTVVALVITMGLSYRVLGCYLAALLLVASFCYSLLQGLAIREQRFVMVYAFLLFVLIGSFGSLAVSPANFPWYLRCSFAATALSIGITDCLWAFWEFKKQGRKSAVIGTYYLAIWLISLDMISFAKYLHGNPI